MQKLLYGGLCRLARQVLAAIFKKPVITFRNRVRLRAGEWFAVSHFEHASVKETI